MPEVTGRSCIRYRFVRIRFVAIRFAWILFAFLSCTLFVNTDTASALDDQQLLTFEQAVQSALIHNQAMKDARAEAASKQLEQKQAQAAVALQQQKSFTSFAKARTLAQDIDLAMKIPNAVRAWQSAVKSVASKERTLRLEVLRQYITTVQMEAGEREALNRRDELILEVRKVNQKISFSLAGAEELDQVKKRLEQAESALKVAQLGYKAARLQLGDMIGMNLESGYRFNYDAYYMKLNSSRLWTWISVAEAADYELYQAVQKKTQASEKVRRTLQLYTEKFGAGITKAIEGFSATADPHSATFMAQYESMLQAIKAEWEGVFWIPAPPAVLPIPKTVFQGEYDGFRYFDDQPYALPLFLSEERQAGSAEAEARKAFLGKIKQSFLDAKTAEEAYAQGLKDLALKKEELKKAELKFQTGLIGREQLDSISDEVNNVQQTAHTLRYSYQLAVEKLNVDTGGALDNERKPGLLPYHNLDDGLSPLNDFMPTQTAAAGAWQIAPVVSGMTDAFSLDWESGIEADGYMLMTESGQSLTPVIKMTDAVTLPHVAFLQPGQIRVVVYLKDAAIAFGILSGGGSSGDVELGTMSEIQIPEPFPAFAAGADPDGGTFFIGTMRIHRQALTEARLAAASETMASSGQGMFYRSEYAGGFWLDVSKVEGAEDVVNAGSGAFVKDETISGMKQTLHIDAAGQLTSLLDSDMLDTEIDQLKSVLEQLAEQREEALASQQLAESGRLSLEEKKTLAELAFLEALSAGQMTEAGSLLEKAHQSEALMKELASDALGMLEDQKEELVKQLEQAERNGDEAAIAALTEQLQEKSSALDAAMQASEASSDPVARLQERLQEQKETLQEAIANQDMVQVREAFAEIVKTTVALKQLESGLGEAVDNLQLMQQSLFEQARAAQNAGNHQEAADKREAAESLAIPLLVAQQRVVFEQMQGKQDLLRDLKPTEASSGFEETAAQSQQQMLQLLIENDLNQIIDLQKGLYTEEEMNEIKRISDQLDQSGKVMSLPVEHIVSSTIIIHLDTPAVWVDGQVFIPLRPVSEAFGAVVDWHGDERSVTISTEGTVIHTRVGDKIAYADGKALSLERAPMIVHGRVMVPLRFIAEAIGLHVEWNGASRIIRIEP